MKILGVLVASDTHDTGNPSGDTYRLSLFLDVTIKIREVVPTGTSITPFLGTGCYHACGHTALSAAPTGDTQPRRRTRVALFHSCFRALSIHCQWLVVLL